MTRGTTSDVALRLVGIGVLLGTAGVLLFGTVHALAIVPIWGRLAGGLAFAIVAALGVTWVFHTLARAGRWSLTLGAGLRFGALCWVAEVPATIFVNAMRLAASSVAARVGRSSFVSPGGLHGRRSFRGARPQLAHRTRRRSRNRGADRYGWWCGAGCE